MRRGGKRESLGEEVRRLERGRGAGMEMEAGTEAGGRGRGKNSWWLWSLFSVTESRRHGLTVLPRALN